MTTPGCGRPSAERSSTRTGLRARYCRTMPSEVLCRRRLPPHGGRHAGRPPSRRKRFHRREFIRLNATGLAALSLTPELATPDGASGRGPDAIRSTAQETPRQGADPMMLAGRPDPTSAAAETGLEPRVWRPADWPDTQLDLNVVRHQDPEPPTSRGNRSPALFSFGGIGPRPTTTRLVHAPLPLLSAVEGGRAAPFLGGSRVADHVEGQRPPLPHPHQFPAG